MNRALFSIFMIMALVIAAMTLANRHTPNPIPTSVIGEKPGKTMGNQVVSLVPETINSKQARLLKMAYDIAKEEGFRNPEILQGLILQETMAGGMKVYKVANPGPEAYYGVGQIKLPATKDVLKRNPGLYTEHNFHTRTDDEIKANLILNDRFNLQVAAKYLKMLQDEYGFTGRQLVNAYNRGPGGVKAVDDSFHYARGAESKLTRWKSTGKVS